MKNMCLMVSLCVLMGGCTVAQKADLPDTMQPARIKSVMKQVADWQLANPSRHHPADWTHGALYAGLFEWAQMADTDTYYQALLGFGEKNQWQPHKRIYHADDHTVGQMYLEMYKKYRDPKMIQGIQDQFDYILANPSDVTLEKGKQKNKDRWWWCDALFMAPPVWTRLAALTGDQRYLNFMHAEWKATTDYLYDQEEHLYFRDDSFFEPREANQEKIFWSRGNGWVFGGLAMVLEEMPLDYRYRPYYEKLYKEMAAKLVAIQPEDGMWRPSLLDPDSFPVPESSGTGFFCYGLAWGINHGLLDEKTYLPAVIKSWQGLVRNVHPDGKLGYVQQIGHDPKMTTADQTEIYGVGAFLLAGSQVYNIAVSHGLQTATVTVKNPATLFRDSEIVSLDAKTVLKSVSKLTRKNAAVYDLETSALVRTQWLDDQLLFQTDLSPNARRLFRIMPKPEGLSEPDSAARTYCRFVPERKDDFAWENDKVCNRMYGPALEYETISSGIDAWGKCVAYPVFDKMIKAYNEKGVAYHENHGEGGDFYKVGPTLGCGGMAPFINDKVLLPSRNFSRWKVIANGPIRSIFELIYQPWPAGPYTVSETKRVSIDLGSNMTRIECDYDSNDTQTLPLAAGIVLRETSDRTWTAEDTAAYWLPTDGHDYGMMGCGIVFESDYDTTAVTADNHLLLVVNQAVDKPVVYYAGSCWDQNAEFSSFEKWQQYLTNFKSRIDQPVVVEMQD